MLYFRLIGDPDEAAENIIPVIEFLSNLIEILDEYNDKKNKLNYILRSLVIKGIRLLSISNTAIHLQVSRKLMG